MPELPEVETTRRGLEPHLQGAVVCDCVVREHRLRWPIAADLAQHLCGQRLKGIRRRAKYLLFEFETGCLMIHLGMSGSLRVINSVAPPGKHDHVDLGFDNGNTLRFRDPRRFGSIHWLDSDAEEHALLANLGPEPLSDQFTGEFLYARSRGRKVAVKPFIMNHHVVVGVGNIYATEALFRAGISPRRLASNISLNRYLLLVDAIKAVLQDAIAQGGTTLRDFVGGDGEAGYFSISLQAYGRVGLPCVRCSAALKGVRLGQRATAYCPRCQR